MPTPITPSVLCAVDSTSVFKLDIFKGKVLFCTGGGSGICKGMTEVVMRHGACAAIVSRNLERLAASAEDLTAKTGQRCIPLQADVRYPEQLKAAVLKCVEEFGRIDFVICGAAGNFLAPIDGLSENGFKTVIDIDTLGTFNTIKATLGHVRAARGAYVHVSATLHYNATPWQIHASAAKAAVDAISACVAVELGPHGVRSNVIAPGLIANTAAQDKLTNRDGSTFQAGGVPLTRMGDIRDIANAAVFLFSGAASFITGQIIVVDGGSEHLRTTQLPYPESVLFPERMKDIISQQQ